MSTSYRTAIIAPVLVCAPLLAAEPCAEAIENALLPTFWMADEGPVPQPLADVMEQLSVPGVSVAVVHDGRIAWAQGWGFTDAGTQEPITPDTIFQAASISKPIAAMAILAAADDGRLDLDVDVNTLLADYQLPANDFTKDQPVTTRRILRHTAGLNMRGFPGFPADQPMSTPIEVLTGADGREPLEVVAVPGTQYAYSGGGFTLLQLLLEQAYEGRPFSDIMRTLILDPLGLDDSAFEMPPPDDMTDRIATAHDEEGTPVVGRWHTYPQLAAGGLWTTPTDLAKYMLSIQTARLTGTHPVLTKPTLDAMLRRGKHGHFGLGIEIFGDRFEHGGSNQGYQCWLVGMIDQGEGIVVMTNGANGYQIAERIAFTAAEHYGWTGPSPLVRTPVPENNADRSRVAGTYQADEFGSITIEHRPDDGLYAVIDGYPELKLARLSDTDWCFRATGEILTFSGTQGKAASFEINGLAFARTD